MYVTSSAFSYTLLMLIYVVKTNVVEDDHDTPELRNQDFDRIVPTTELEWVNRYVHSSTPTV